MKRIWIITFSGLLISSSLWAQNVKDKYHGSDDMYGGKTRYKEKRIQYDNYNPDKYKEDASGNQYKAVTVRQKAEAERYASYYGYDQASIDKNKQPTWEAWEVYTQRQVDTSLINKYFRARNTVVMVNLYPVDSSSIKWIDKKADRKKARQARRLARASRPRYYSNYGGYGYNNYGYGGYGYPYYGGGFGLRPSIGFGWNSNTGWGVGMGWGMGFGGYSRPYYGYGRGWNGCSGGTVIINSGGGSSNNGGAGTTRGPVRYR